MKLSKLLTSKQLSPIPSSSSHHNQQPIQSLTTLFKTGFNPTHKDYTNFLLHLLKSQKFRFITHFISQLTSNQIEQHHIFSSIFTKSLLNHQIHEKALTFINTHMEKTPIVVQNRILDALIQAFCINEQDPERGLSILQHFLKKDGIFPSSFTFCALIRAFCLKGEMDRAMEVVGMMSDEKFKYPFDSFVISCVVSGFVSIGKNELALGFYENVVSSGGVKMNVVAYTCVLSAYCRLKRFEKVCDLGCEIEKGGLAFDVVFYGCLVHEYFKAGMVVSALEKHREMVERKIEPDTVSYTILVDGFSKEGLVEKGVGFLHKMRKEGVEPNLITYTSIMLGFCKKGKLEEALNVFKIVEDLGMKADEFVYATLIDGFCRIRDFDNVFRLLDGMNEKGVHPSVVTYNTIINGLCKSGRTTEACEISKNVDGDVITYSTLLHGYIKEKDSTGLLMTKKRLEEAGIQMDVIMCNVLIKALFMVGSFEDVYVIYKGMSEMGLVPNHVTYCTLIDGYCKFGRIEDALEIFDEFRMTSTDSVACYNCIIDGLCKRNMIDIAIQVFIELNETGMPLDLGICRILLKSISRTMGPEGILDFVSKIEKLDREILHIICNDALCFLCDEGFFESASDLYTFMRKNGFVLTVKSYNSLLEMLFKDRKTCLAKICLSDFVKEIGFFEPRVSKIILDHLCMKDVRLAIKYLESKMAKTQKLTFPVSVLEKLIKNGRACDAFKLLMGSKERLPFMDVVDYTIVVDGLCKGGHIGKALEVCTLAKNYGITLNIITYNSIINGLCHQGCFIEAFRLFDSLENINVIPSEITYSILIDSLSKEGYLLDAKNIFERMVSKNLKPNIRVYNSLINGYSKIGSLSEVLKIVDDLDEKGIKPDEFTVSVVINSFCKSGNMEGALEYYFDSKTNGFSPDLLGYFYLIRGLCSKGRMEESRSILRDTLQNEKVVDMLKKVDTGEETESVDRFLDSLCDRGNIREAVMILDEVVRMFFPVGKKVDETEVRAVGSEPLILDREGDVVSDDFDAYYGLLASLCSKGELTKANKVAKLLTGFDGG
ncbi:putative tetratricopeptide-like helical domain superfamily [Helianthus annuus]|uniref:Putative pentatricopeptide repeat (PPR) superfamily protein n=1 Tax=Helianthus annuus TaxID=4232 RepID=A0A251V5B6_HELAN|nr:pentatricopeptide repeat-containing protein At5g57250, mitochondrial [Helianthus annuus]XP_022027872.1 pentatricopeptide repeat-containing protein At5g57250, mitochondrial [Helianthus annuus]XP_022027873.1 pentatricopeptide repeat-containing protein At5g57250, mitochondrial [Helianthus annuus]XP_022027877.1 pentatricopeptide repeat-containing protein At5g57250, mitochondrial [Helianthus annuus]XP_022027879.1 pentatricopeptide repeat-containing protein At5g57250, mitochondrial [Helianthus ann